MAVLLTFLLLTALGVVAVRAALSAAEADRRLVDIGSGDPIEDDDPRLPYGGGF